MNLVTFNPEHTLDRFFDTDRFFGFPHSNLSRFPVLPKINIIEKEEAFYIEAETPGMTEKDISVEFHAGLLSLKGRHDQKSENDDYHVREFSHHSFERSFRLNDQVDPDKVTARMDQGVLKVTLPKKEQAKLKKIEVKIES